MNREGVKAPGLTDEQINGIMEDYGKCAATFQSAAALARTHGNTRVR